jgi:ribose transport system ATP-binding protein
MDEVLKMSGISKSFPGVQALDNVAFELKKGEVHALIGENGAGKSTLMKILGGVYTPDSGHIEINGRPATITCPADSIKNKIGVIYQEFNLVQTLNVYENLYLGKELKTRSLRLLDRKMMADSAKITMEKLGISDFDCEKKIRTLSVAMQQLVEIGKAIFNEIDILVMDEPTSVLTENESSRLFDVMMNLKEKGLSIIYISHRLEEVIEICDRITVLRDGRFIETVENNKRDISKEYLVQRMVGRSLVDYFPANPAKVREEKVLEVKNLSKHGLFQDVSFCLKKGEILGFSGLVGAGRSEIMKSVFGVIRADAGEIFIEGKKIDIHSPQGAKNAGIAFAPEDRKREGLVLGMSLSDNISLPNLKMLSKVGHILRRVKQGLAAKYIAELKINPDDPSRRVINFSGGNQQKGVIAKWLATGPRVMILDEPTRGIDIGAKVEIYNLINEMAARGVGIIVISSELPELIGICDRILVVSNGVITGEFKRDEFQQDSIMTAATNR